MFFHRGREDKLAQKRNLSLASVINPTDAKRQSNCILANASVDASASRARNLMGISSRKSGRLFRKYCARII